MYFAIDKNTKLPVYKHADGESLHLYLDEVLTGSDWVIISTAEELVAEFKFASDLETIFEYLGGDPFDLDEDMDEMVAEVFSTLCSNEDITEPFKDKYVSKNKEGGRKLGTETTPDPVTKPKPKLKTAGRITAKSLAGESLSCTDKKARDGSVMGNIQRIIENNMGGMLFEDIRETFMFETEKDEKYANGYIAGAIREGYIEIEEEL